MFRQFRQEGDDIMFRLALNLIDAVDARLRIGFVAILPNRLCR